MPNYIVNTNAQSSGDHEVHLSPQSQCSSSRYPLPQNQRALGVHGSCHGAVQEAKRVGYANADGCAYCSPACHRS
jgi:hypothetical protein